MALKIKGVDYDVVACGPSDKPPWLQQEVAGQMPCATRRPRRLVDGLRWSMEAFHMWRPRRSCAFLESETSDSTEEMDRSDLSWTILGSAGGLEHNSLGLSFLDILVLMSFLCWKGQIGESN